MKNTPYFKSHESEMRLFPDFPKNSNEKYVEKELIEMKPSSIPGGGTGVFAKKDIASNTDLGFYRGEHLTDTEFEKKFSDAGLGTYVLTLDEPSDSNKKFYVDGLKKGNWTSRINSPKGTANKANIVFYTDGRVVSKRNIKAGEELFVGYGPKYWNNRYWKNNNKNNVTRKRRI
jgi:SET domain-containing protein